MEQVVKPLFIISDLNGGGAERVLLTVLRNLDKTRFSPTLFLLNREGVYWSEVPGHVRVVWGFKTGKLRHAFLPVLTKLVREARGHDVVVGALELTPTYLAWLAGLLSRKPAVGWVHSYIPGRIASEPWWHRYVTQVVYRRLRDLIFVSQGSMDSMAIFLGLEPRQGWRTIYNPFDWLSYGCASAMTRGVNYKPNGQPTVIGMGRLSEEKGFDVLIRAHARLLREGFAHRLLILGAGPGQKDLEELMDELDVRSTVSLRGFVSDPLPYLKASTVFALPSRYEGFSMAILESLAVGLPVVSADCPVGPAEILDRGRYGLLVPVGDDEALAGALKRMLSDVELRTQMSAAGLIRMLDFSPERAAREWEALLVSVCSPGMDLKKG